MKAKAIRAAEHTTGLVIEDADWDTRNINGVEHRITLLIDDQDLPDLIQTLSQAASKEQ